MARINSKTTYLPNPVFTYRDTAIVLLRTSFIHYEMAMQLNDAHKLRLARVPDLRLSDGDHPCFSYNDSSARLAYVLLDIPTNKQRNKCFEFYDKMLLIRGRDSWEFQAKLYQAATSAHPEPEAAKMLAHRRWVLENMLNNGIFTIDTFDFRADAAKTSLHAGDPATMPKSVATYLKELKKFTDELFSQLELTIGDEDDNYDGTRFGW